ncbi:MAG: hypothetical protein N2515_03695, partial [Deltaproteobacteria bacterium]|nr:hypothetical protein [Deltaproteobacteria bacterium]
MQASCSSDGRRILEWELELGIGIELERAAFLEVELLEGGCVAGARAIHWWGFGRGEGRDRMEMPRDVRAGRYGVHARVLGRMCEILGEVCEEVEVPWEGKRRVIVRKVDGERLACGRESCENGRCVVRDGGVGDAWGFDGDGGGADDAWVRDAWDGGMDAMADA